jgi:protein FAM50
MSDQPAQETDAKSVGSSDKKRKAEPRADDSVGSTATVKPRKKPLSKLAKLSFLDEDDLPTSDKKISANSSVSYTPKLMTKAALEKEAQTREKLRQEFITMQEAVKATDVVIPFVFYDGTNIPGGTCKVKKGDHIWFFLDKARKVGAGLGAGGAARKGWARTSVDDLMFVRGDMIIPHVSYWQRLQDY